MSLFKVTLTYTLVAVGETAHDAIWNAEEGVCDSEPDASAVEVITTIDEVPWGWKSAYPWGGDGEKTCRQLLAIPPAPEDKP